jgi:undecaprenyl-diphosphatase
MTTGIVVTEICALSAPWFDAGYPLGEWANWSLAVLGLASLALASVRYWPLFRNRQRLPLRDLGRNE